MTEIFAEYWSVVCNVHGDWLSVDPRTSKLGGSFFVPILFIHFEDVCKKCTGSVQKMEKSNVKHSSCVRIQLRRKRNISCIVLFSETMGAHCIYDLRREGAWNDLGLLVQRERSTHRPGTQRLSTFHNHLLYFSCDSGRVLDQVRHLFHGMELGRTGRNASFCM